jgi:hypothetical protein
VLLSTLPALPPAERSITVKAQAANTELASAAPQQSSMRIYPELHIHSASAAAISLASLSLSTRAAAEAPLFARPAAVMSGNCTFAVPTAASALAHCMAQPSAKQPFVASVPKPAAMLRSLDRLHSTSWRDDGMIVHHFLGYQPQLVFDMLQPETAAQRAVRTYSHAAADAERAATSCAASEPSVADVVWTIPTLGAEDLITASQPASRTGSGSAHAAAQSQGNKPTGGRLLQPPLSRDSGCARGSSDLGALLGTADSPSACSKPPALADRALQAPRSSCGSGVDLSVNRSDSDGAGVAETLRRVNSSPEPTRVSAAQSGGVPQAERKSAMATVTLDADLAVDHKQTSRTRQHARGSFLSVSAGSMAAQSPPIFRAESVCKQPGMQSSGQSTVGSVPDESASTCALPALRPEPPSSTSATKVDLNLGLPKDGAVHARLPRFSSLPPSGTNSDAATSFAISPSRALLDYLWRRTGGKGDLQNVSMQRGSVQHVPLVQSRGQASVASNGRSGGYATAVSRLSKSALPPPPAPSMPVLRSISDQLASCAALHASGAPESATSESNGADERHDAGRDVYLPASSTCSGPMSNSDLQREVHGDAAADDLASRCVVCLQIQS